ncbi:hypothetical protein [Goodfellowiella coeruleoviolacea]|uniref:VCBS repeat-containing protein n=1 Tax=Goodfellowiella coeruleoviolacea TaxID=334858 RepID=A0AAE3GL70_9PSEU|nr:hypothetical protein [Goodfellowiella coeruleoviolacea]MCP2169575.1 hypothetical protein [Goodfellowiella coeruleoviolacea]
MAVVLVALAAGLVSRADTTHHAVADQQHVADGSAPTTPAGARPADVPECAAGCDTAFTLALPGDAVLAGLQTTPVASPPVALLGYWVAGRLRASTTVSGQDGLPYEQVISGSCAPDGDSQRCVVSFAFAMQGRAVAALRVHPDHGITPTDTVEGEAIDPVLVDLDGNGRADAVLRRSTYEPDFATGPQYWETWVEADGVFTHTGCTEPVAGDQPVPTHPATGPCRP